MSAAFDQITRLTRDEFYRADMNGGLGRLCGRLSPPAARHQQRS